MHVIVIDIYVELLMENEKEAADYVKDADRSRLARFDCDEKACMHDI